MKRAILPVLALVVTLGWACTASPSAVYGQEEVIVLEVGPEREPCVGEMEDMCLQVRSPGEEEWRNFYSPIEGFEHEPGVRYTLEVLRTEVLNPPADASAYRYELISILQAAPVEG